MLIFDGFPTREHARAFACQADAVYHRWAVVFDSQEESDAVDPFPYELVPPIVLVEREEMPERNLQEEDAIARMAVNFSGRFAGT